jgi:hypothetical protein
MFYWPVDCGFDERLSILVKQGKVRSGVYNTGTARSHRRTCFACDARITSVRSIATSEPSHERSRAAGHDVADVREADRIVHGRDSSYSGVSELGIFGNTSMLGRSAGRGWPALTLRWSRSTIVVAYSA